MSEMLESLCGKARRAECEKNDALLAAELLPLDAAQRAEQFHKRNDRLALEADRLQRDIGWQA